MNIDKMAVAREASAKKRAEGSFAAPEHNPVKKFWANPSMGKAIKAMCAHCMGCTREEAEPGFKGLIRDCSSTDCPLWMFRPYKTKEEKVNV